jgi:transposase
MSASGKREPYTAEFKREAVELITQQHLSVKEAAAKLGIAVNMLYRWKKELSDSGSDAFPGHGQQTGVEAELRRLRAENQRLRMERDILKKATAFFAKESK